VNADFGDSLVISEPVPAEVLTGIKPALLAKYSDIQTEQVFALAPPAGPSRSVPMTAAHRSMNHKSLGNPHPKTALDSMPKAMTIKDISKQTGAIIVLH
jgi:hypothetical protein